MKRYLLVGIALLFVSANASLKEDFAQMDLAEEQLLSDMRKSAALTGEEDDVEETVAPEKEPEPEKIEKEEVVPSSPEENSAIMAASLDAVTSESKSVDEEDDAEARLAAIRQREAEEAREKEEAQKAALEEAKKLEAKKQEEQKAEALKAEIVAKEAEINKAKAAEEAARAQREAEKREVEAYEKQRAEKLAQEAAEKAELEKKQLAQKALDEAAAKEESMQKASTEETKEVVMAAGDVNISRELEEKTEAANEEYEKAIKEMNEAD